MRFTCEKSTLVSAISVASRTVAQKSTLPAIEGIYCQASLDLQLTGYNLETAITVSAQADIQEQGACYSLPDYCSISSAVCRRAPFLFG